MLQVSQPNHFHLINNCWATSAANIIDNHLMHVLETFLSSLLQFLGLFSPHWLWWNCSAATFASTTEKKGCSDLDRECENQLPKLSQSHAAYYCAHAEPMEMAKTSTMAATHQ